MSIPKTSQRRSRLAPFYGIEHFLAVGMRKNKSRAGARLPELVPYSR